MLYGRKKNSPAKQAGDLEEFKRELEIRERGYRARALALFPHICGHCGREFEGKKLRELTVHHKDHNHDNNPGDGSNWELLCSYCHEYEHVNHMDSGRTAGLRENKGQEPGATFKPFGKLGSLLDPKKKPLSSKNNPG